MNYHYFGLLATIILAFGLLLVVHRWPQGRHKTFSQHVALQRASVIYYSSLFAVVLPLLILFFIKWFTPEFGLTGWFNGLVIAGAVFQQACTLVPETGGRMTDWHRALAGLSALCLLPAQAILLCSTSVGGPAAKVIISFGLIGMLVCIWLVVRAKGTPRNFLIIQSTYFAAFLLPIMYISYIQ